MSILQVLAGQGKRVASRLCVAAALVGGLAMAGEAQAANYTVTKTADTNDGACNSDCSLREAFVTANGSAGSDTITVPAGTYTLTGALTATQAGGLLTINGADAATTIVQAGTTGGANGNGTDRIFSVTGGGDLTVSGLTIRYGKSSGRGGGILNTGGALLVRNCIVRDNFTPGGDGGGGICNNASSSFSATTTVQNSLISGNDAGNNGGGIYNVNNDAAAGTMTASLIVQNCTISGNFTPGSGGGINNFSPRCTATVENSTISGNSAVEASRVGSASHAGSGISNSNTMTVRNCTISNNTAIGDGTDIARGGGIYNLGSSGTLTVQSCTISNNTVTTNGAAGDGGGIYRTATSGTLNLSNSIVDSNSATTSAPDVFGAITSQGYNLIGKTDGATINGDATGNKTGTVTSPLDPGLGTLADNGGPTFTRALLTGSPAINAGSNTLASNAGLTTDQRGAGFPRIVGSSVDIGAFEVQVQLPTFSINSVSQAEGNSGTSTYSFTVTRSGDTASTSSVNYSVGGGTATSGSDYGTAFDSDGATPGTLNFAAGATSATITVPVVGDTLFEADETFNITLSATTGTALGSPSVGTGTIQDDDLATNIDVTRPGDTIIANTGSATTASAQVPAAEGVANAIDNDATTKYLNLDKLNTGFTVTPSLGATFVTGLRLTTANDSPERDPITFTLEGSNNGTTFTSIVSGASNAATGLDTNPGRNAVGVAVPISNSTAYRYYRLLFPTVRDAAAANSMQVGEVELLGRVVPTLSINSVAQLEGDSGTSAFTFTVTRSGEVSNTASVNYATSNGSATAGSDYTAASGTLNFAAGQATGTISVSVTGDTVAEANETFRVTLSNPVNATLTTATGTGTIRDDDTSVAASGAVISEFRFRGPSGSPDEYVEITNTSGGPLNISGWSINYGGIAAAVTVPAGTVLPRGGHFLFGGTEYSLSSYAARDALMTGNASDTSGVALLNAAVPPVRVDAVGFASADATLREGAGLASAPTDNTQSAFVRDFSSLRPRDTGDNAADFQFVSVTGGTFAGTAGSVPSILGAPGPQGLTSPLQPLVGLAVAVLSGTDPLLSPNRVRRSDDTGTNKTFGSILVRRRITNTSGAPITRLRFRAARITTLGNSVAPAADLRLLSSADEASVGVVRNGQMVNEPVFGTTLEAGAPLGQAAGGGLNSSTIDGTLTLDTPLPNNTSRNYSFLLGVVRTGNYALTLTVEGLN